MQLFDNLLFVVNLERLLMPLFFYVMKEPVGNLKVDICRYLLVGEGESEGLEMYFMDVPYLKSTFVFYYI